MKNFSLNQKIAFIFGLFALALVGVSALAVKSLATVDETLNEIVNHNVVRVQNSTTVRGSFRAAAILLLTELSDEDKTERVKVAEKAVVAHEEFLKFLEQATESSSEKAHPLYVKIHDEYLTWWGVANKAREAKNAGRPYSELMQEAKVVRASAEEQLAEMIKMNQASMDEAKVESENRYIYSRNIMIGASALAIIVASILGFLVLSSTSRTISRIIQSLKEGSVQVSSAAQQIAASSEQLSQSSTEQAASLEETAASIEEMNSMINKNAENASGAARTSKESQDAVAEGKSVVEKMIQSMNAINKNSEQMNEIVKVIEDIGAKTKVINDIVFQTKLLSFNASVEAARAGEHGKGFAVVAEEVGNLAQMSGNAAHEISALLESSTAKVQRIIEETKGNVETGSEVARQCDQVFESVVSNVTKVTGMAGEISSASEEQARGSAEVSKAMAQVDQATQQNSATSEECASASEELAAQAEILESTVSELVGAIMGANVVTHTTKASSHKAAPKAVHHNVVHMKKPAKLAAKAPASGLKAASGEAPAYDSPGFEEV